MMAVISWSVEIWTSDDQFRAHNDKKVCIYHGSYEQSMRT